MNFSFSILYFFASGHDSVESHIEELKVDIQKNQNVNYINLSISYFFNIISLLMS